MDTQTGKVRELGLGEKPKSVEVMVNKPNPNCSRCGGEGSILREKATRPERRRADKSGVPVSSSYIPCPECNPKGAADASVS